MCRSVIFGFLAIVLAIGCGKDSTTGSGDGDKAGKSGESATTDTPKAPAKNKYGDKQFFDYPPEGEGPHAGWDLNALREKLQGVWLLGGGYFGPPTIWHIEGDVLRIGATDEPFDHE